MNSEIILEETDMTQGTLNCLKRADYRTVADMHGVTAEELMALHGFGVGYLDDLRVSLMPYGVTIYGSDNPLTIRRVAGMLREGCRTAGEIAVFANCSRAHAEEALAICEEHGLLEQVNG